MFTQCPKCQSVFMVSDKDIKAHEGLVRCGNCYSVFNSSWNLTDDPRRDFVEGQISAGGDVKPSTGQGSGFTFSILDQNSAASADSKSPAKLQAEEPGEFENQEVGNTGESDQPHDDFLEPFPEPEMDQSMQAADSVPEENKSQDDLLYFDTGDGEEEEDVAEISSNAATIEDLTILQTPSFSNEIPDHDQDEPVLNPELIDDEEPLLSMSEESMWPGSEISFEESDVDLPVLDVSSSEEETSVSEVDEDQAELSSFSIDEQLLEKQLLEESSFDEPQIDEQQLDSLIEEPLENEQLDDEVQDEDALAEVVPIDDWLQDGPERGAEELSPNEEELTETLLTSAGVESEADTLEQVDDDGKKILSDDTFAVPGEEETDDQFSLDSLPESTGEAFALDLDEEGQAGDETVFITSAEEEVDDAYVPISLKRTEEKELFHGLDDFPEPGELSEMNYEDTMEINAMFEAANISKEQIEEALSVADIDDEESDARDADIAEEILLSSDDELDLAETLSSSDEKGEENVLLEDDSQLEIEKKNKSFISNLTNFLPLSLARNKTWTEPAILDPEETQLIQNLHRDRDKPELPEWIKKYTTLAVSGLLVVTLIGQVGYFYMDELVRITPLRPVLEVGCKVAACTVPAVQNTKDIEQLSSGMAPLVGSDGGLKVSSILVNRDIRPQAFPALELTLTDRAGNIISRRVVTRDKYLTDGDSTEMKPNEAVDINIRFRTPSIRVDGFELRPVSQNWLERTK